MPKPPPKVVLEPKAGDGDLLEIPNPVLNLDAEPKTNLGPESLFSGPVSYTHLDVYKRQFIYFPENFSTAYAYRFGATRLLTCLFRKKTRNLKVNKTRNSVNLTRISLRCYVRALKLLGNFKREKPFVKVEEQGAVPHDARIRGTLA